ncbi:MAG: Gfo/Idh/MocA family oxidoreductase [Pseudomonadota bacterium]
MSEPLPVAVVGAGYFGQFHYDAWSRMPEVRLAAICVRNPDGAAETAARWGGGGTLPIYTDPARMMAEAAPKIVDITAPPTSHLAMIRALAPAQPWIVCQKPFCDGVAGAQAAVDCAQSHGARLAVHENIRFQPWYRAAKRLIAAGVLGQIYQASFRLRPGDGQGPQAYLDRQPYFQAMPRFLVHETAIHWIDTFRYLLGEPSGVFARLARLNPVIAGEDAGLILFDFADGARAVFDGNRLSDHVAQNRRRTLGELVIEGSEASLRLDGNARLWLRRFGENTETEQRFDWSDHLFGGDCVYLCNRAILRAWLAGETPETEASRYLRNQVIEEAIYESASAGRYLSLPQP